MNTENISFAFFDFDGTLIKGDSIVSYVAYARKAGKISKKEHRALIRALIKYLLRVIDDTAIKNVALAFTNRMTQEERDAFDSAFAKELVQRVYKLGLEEIELCRMQRLSTMLVSASTENYMRYVAQLLHFDALLCTKLNADGKVQKNCKGQEKVARIEQFIKENNLLMDASSSFAYGDSKSDEPMLGMVGHPFAVNAKRTLRQLSLGRFSFIRWK